LRESGGSSIHERHIVDGTALVNLGIEADREGYPGIDFKGELDFKYTGLLIYYKNDI
jgi:hypothetical protein